MKKELEQVATDAPREDFKSVKISGREFNHIGKGTVISDDTSELLTMYVQLGVMFDNVSAILNKRVGHVSTEELGDLSDKLFKVEDALWRIISNTMRCTLQDTDNGEI